MRKSKYYRTIESAFFLAIYLFSFCVALPQPQTQVPAKKESRLSPKIPDVLENDLLGKVRSTKDLSYVPELKFEMWEIGKPFKTLSDNYDSDGYYTSSILRVYRGIETLTDKAFRELDNHYFSDSADIRISILSFKYDYENKIIFKERKFGDSLSNDESEMQKEKSATKYSLVGTTEFDGDGKIKWKEIVNNASDGKKISTVYNDDGSIIERTTVKGNETAYENLEYGSGWKEQSFMNNSENVTERWSFDEKKKTLILDKKTIRSDTRDQIVETEIYFRKGMEYLRLERVYKKTPKVQIEYKQIVTMPHTNADGDPAKSYHFKYEYKFDPAGNWIEKRELHKVSKFGKVIFEPFQIVQREISYYQ